MMKNYKFKPPLNRIAGMALAVFLLVFSNQQVLAQCTNASQFGTINAPTNNTTTTITTCAFGGEYSTINSCTAGSTYLFNATGGTGNYITIHQGTPGGTVLGFGFAPVSVVCTVSGPLYLHYNTNAACGTDGSCHTGTVQCTSCPGAPDPCLSILTIACATSTTATLSGTGLWSPGSCGFSTPGTEKLYSFTPTTTGVHNLQVTSTNSGGFIDYFIKAASGGCNATGWTCIDDIFSPSTVSMGTLTAGTAYYILLDPETSSSVTHTFQINCPAPPVDPCAAPIETIACASSKTVTLSGSGGNWSPNSCGFSTPGAEKVYSFTPTVTGNHTLQVTAADGTFVDYFFKDASGGCSSTGWTCIDDISSPTSTSFGPLTAGTTYLILLDDETATSTTHTFQINCPNPPVVLTCPTNTTVASCQTQAAVNAEFAAWLATASGSGGCSGVLTNDNAGAPSACGGSTTMTFTYTSTCAPLTTTCQATFTVAAPPTVVLTCPTNTTVASCQTQAAVNSAFATWLATASASGGCNGVLTNNNTGAPPACGGSTTVTFTYISTCAPLTTTCQATFTVAAAPTVVLTCPVITTLPIGLTQTQVDSSFAVWLATGSASGGCNGVLSNDNSGAPPAAGGSTTVTFTYTSTCAPLTTTCQATFTVSSAPPVVLTCPTNTTVASCQTQAAVNTAFATWLATASGTGGCNGVLTNNNTGAPSACGGSTTVTFIYTSTCQPFTTTCQATFTVAAPPTVVLNCPVNTSAATCQTQAAVNAQFAAWLASASASGGCNGVLTNNNTGAPAACGGSTTVTFTYTNTCAPLTTTCQAVFTVPAAPTVVLTCPTNITTAACQTQAAVNTAFATWLAIASASGGCNGVLTNNNTGAPAACGGSTTVTFTYTSTCAPLTTTCQATFTVAAAPPVVLTCPLNTTASACLTQAQLNSAYTAWLATATATGGCNGVLTNNAPAAPLICSATAQTITVTFTYTSSCAPATTTCQATFTVPAYPTFTMPANGTSQVACPALIVQPTPPTVVDGCGKTLVPTGPIITNNPNPITCEGTRTFVWTYTDCAGHALTWTHVTTVERQPFGVPASGGSTVACPDLTDAQPVPPVVTSNCGEVLTPVITSTAKPGCEGNRNWNFTYTDCEGNTAIWVYIYTVEYLDFTVPANEVLTVECPLNAVEPTPPTVLDNCGKTVNMNGPVVTSTNNANGCEATRTYAWTYKDCEGNAHIWSRKYNFQYTADFFIYPDGEEFVGCLLFAQPPVPPTVYDNCGLEVATTGPVVTESVSGCAGWRKFTYNYKDCGGHSKNWSFTYFANDTEPPVGNCHSGTIASIDVTNLSCLADVPCPDDYNFSAKAAELITAGGFYDLCSGTDLVVELDSWTALWECSDPNGDGINTFGRTFYFRIADQCGNEFPSLCGVTYSGLCSPIETFPQGAWGNVGDEPGSDIGANTTDIQVITALLANNPLVVGGGNRSLTFTDANCVVALLPGIGSPTVLANCQQLNCSGCNPAGPIGMKNILAANTAALMLNMRYNVNYNGIPMSTVRLQDLGCIVISPDIKVCSENGGCKLRVFESNGTAHDFPYNIGGLVDLSNLYLGGNLQLSPAFSLVYASAINTSIANVNNYFHGDMSQNAGCNPSPGIAPGLADDVAKPLPTGNAGAVQVAIQLAPNPTSGEVVLKLTEMVEKQEVTMAVFNSLGQEVLRHDFGAVTFVNERIDLRALGNGLYFVNLRVGNERFEKRLVIAND